MILNWPNIRHIQPTCSCCQLGDKITLTWSSHQRFLFTRTEAIVIYSLCQSRILIPRIILVHTNSCSTCEPLLLYLCFSLLGPWGVDVMVCGAQLSSEAGPTLVAGFTHNLSHIIICWFNDPLNLSFLGIWKQFRNPWHFQAIRMAYEHYCRLSNFVSFWNLIRELKAPTDKVRHIAIPDTQWFTPIALATVSSVSNSI